MVVGSKVAYRTGWMGTGWGISEIVKVTPSGRMNLKHGVVLNPDGTIRGDGHRSVYPVTDEISVSLWRENAMGKIRRELNLEKFSNSELSVLLDIMKGHDKEGRK